DGEALVLAGAEHAGDGRIGGHELLDGEGAAIRQVGHEVDPGRAQRLVQHPRVLDAVRHPRHGLRLHDPSPPPLLAGTLPKGGRAVNRASVRPRPAGRGRTLARLAIATRAGPAWIVLA